MELNEIMAALQESIASLSKQLDDAKTAVDAEKKKSYDEGFAGGVASMNNGSDKIYSQVELDAKLAEAVDPLKVQIDELTKKVADLEAQLADAGTKAVAAFKAEALEKFKAQQAAESEGEASIEALLM